MPPGPPGEDRLHDTASVIAALERSPAILIPLVREMPEAYRRRRPQPGRWSVHEHACHLAAVHGLFFERLERMLAEDHPQLIPYQPHVDDPEGLLLQIDLEEAFERYAGDRAALVGRLRALSPEQWERTAEHPEYARYSVFVMFRHLALHDLFHGYRIEELVLRRDWAEEAAAVEVATGIPGVAESLRPGEVSVLGPFAVPGLAPRRVRVYLPRGWGRATPSPALWLFDGQNVFDDAPSFAGGWYAHEAAESLARGRGGRPVPVVIGIDHGNDGRINELSPFAFGDKPSHARAFLDWVTGELKPALEAELNLVPGPFGSVVGGSSMGGLAALWAHFHEPESFGGALVMSPSFWLAERAIFADVAAQPAPEVSRIYLDGGRREDKGRVVELVREMAAHLVTRAGTPSASCGGPTPGAPTARRAGGDGCRGPCGSSIRSGRGEGREERAGRLG